MPRVKTIPRPPAVEAGGTPVGLAMPAPAPFSDAILLALQAEGDQPVGVETSLGGELTITVGIRNVYIRLGGRTVYAVPCRALDTGEVT